MPQIWSVVWVYFSRNSYWKTHPDSIPLNKDWSLMLLCIWMPASSFSKECEMEFLPHSYTGLSLKQNCCHLHEFSCFFYIKKHHSWSYRWLVFPQKEEWRGSWDLHPNVQPLFPPRWMQLCPNCTWLQIGAKIIQSGKDEGRCILSCRCGGLMICAESQRSSRTDILMSPTFFYR